MRIYFKTNAEGALNPVMMHIYIDNLERLFPIGILPHEKLAKQRLRLNIEVTCTDPQHCDEDINNTFNYGTLLEAVEAMATGKQIALLETVCQRLADVALAHPAVQQITVRVDKLDLLEGAATVGLRRTFGPE
jgi:7,8-dihydroneopterin aldolase/epimerase/oxygenase